jgi:hypothetical protein
MRTEKNNLTPPQLAERVDLLVDLFVDLNFNKISNKVAISQFKVLAIQMGFPIDMVNEIVHIGMDEYFKLMVQYPNLIASSEELS